MRQFQWPGLDVAVGQGAEQVRDHVAPVLRESAETIEGEGRALEAFLRFAREHRDVYRIIDEAEFVDPAAYREHYETTASRIAGRLRTAREKGQISADYDDKTLEIVAWGMMGANVFLGLRFFVWGKGDAAQVAEAMSRVWRSGFSK